MKKCNQSVQTVAQQVPTNHKSQQTCPEEEDEEEDEMDDFPRFTHSEYKRGNDDQSTKLVAAPAVEEEDELEEDEEFDDGEDEDESKVRTVEQSI